MKKVLNRIIFIVIICLFALSQNSFGFKNTQIESKVMLLCWYGASTDKVLDDLHKMGYKGNSVNKEMVIKSTTTNETGFVLKNYKKGKYEVEISGTPIEASTGQRFTYSQLKTIFGLEEKESNLVNGYFWKATMVLSAPGERREGGDPITAYPVYLKAVYTKSDEDEIVQMDDEVDNTSSNLKNGDLNKDIADTATGVKNTVSSAISTIDKFKNWSKSLGEHPIENLIIHAQNTVLSVFDGLQIFINNIQTQPDHTSQDDEMLYTYQDLEDDGKGNNINKKLTGDTYFSEILKEEKEKSGSGESSTNETSNSNESQTNEEKSLGNEEDKSDQGIGNRDKYTRVSDYIENDKSITYINIKSSDYRKSTKIPVMVADFYNVATGKIDFFDTNFLTGDKTKKRKALETEDGKTELILKHEENSVWLEITKIVKTIIRVTLYIASAILLTLLIWHGVHVIGKSSVGSPVARSEHKKALNRFFMSILMLISSILIMAFCIFGTNEIFNLIQTEDDTYELPIRINVNGAYSFSTTPTGYVRYLASTDMWSSCSKKVAYTIMYAFLVIMNFLTIGFMGGRVFIMWFLSILGPILAVFTIFGNGGTSRYRSWIILYISLSIVPTIMCLLNKIMINAI